MKTEYRIDKMDCAAEEQLVRMKLAAVEGIEHLDFDLPGRRLVVRHSGPIPDITAALQPLDLDTQLLSSSADSEEIDAKGEASDERRPLTIALLINAAFFVGEFTAGLLAGSMGLVADSLDMLADASVYGLSLAAVGHVARRKLKLARWSGYLQFGLAALGLVEVLRRFWTVEGAPDVAAMIVVAGLALGANVVTLLLLNRVRRGEAHIEASWIFTSNDIKVNALVILAGIVVLLTGSAFPDLIAGGIIFIIVARGARKILALSAG